MRLIIVRHGETEENKAGIMQGHLPGRLSVLGKQQAKKLAARLEKEENLDFIFSSDLARAADTAAEIGLRHPGIKIELTRELREDDVGDFTGKNRRDLGAAAEDSRSFFREMKNGESLEKLYKRAENFLHKILKLYPKNTVLFVAHGGFNKALIAVILGKKPEDIPDIPSLHNTSVNIFEIDEHKNHKIHLLNDISHLR